MQIESEIKNCLAEMTQGHAVPCNYNVFANGCIVFTSPWAGGKTLWFPNGLAFLKECNVFGINSTGTVVKDSDTAILESIAKCEGQPHYGEVLRKMRELIASQAI